MAAQTPDLGFLERLLVDVYDTTTAAGLRAFDHAMAKVRTASAEELRRMAEQLERPEPELRVTQTGPGRRRR